MSTLQILKELQKELQKHKKIMGQYQNQSDVDYFYNKGWNTAMNRCTDIIESFIQSEMYFPGPDNKTKTKTKPLYSLLYKLEKEYHSAISEYEKRCDILQSNNVQPLLDIDTIILLEYQKNIENLRAKINGVKDSILATFAENIDY